VGNRFKGIIDSTEVFSDTVKIIGDVTVAASGNLLVKEGAFVEFQDHYKLDIFGKFNALGLENKTITFNAKDTSLIEATGPGNILQNGWSGIRFYHIKSDTLRLRFCNIYNTGVKTTPEGGVYTSPTIFVKNSDNIYFEHCIFNSNYALRDANNANSGLSLDTASNIHVTNCTFSNGVYPDFYGGGIVYMNQSDLVIDGSKFLNTKCEYAMIYNFNSTLTLRNSYFSNNWANRMVDLNGKKSLIENNEFIDNKSYGIWVNITDTTVIRNNIFIRNVTPITLHRYAVVTGNIIAYNTTNCGCSNFFGTAINMSGATAYIANNTIVGNYSDGSQAHAIYASHSSPIIINNLLWKNSGTPIGWHSGYNEPDPIIANNYTSDPKFSDTIDFRLNNSSGCINKGLPVISKNLCVTDVYGNFRIDTIAGKIDIGAVEFQGEALIIPSSVANLNYVTSVYPNPVKDYLVLEALFENVSYQIFNMKGFSVKEGESTDFLIHVSELENGIYILKIGKNGKSYVAKFLKE
jgi:hypothetical protein